MRKVATSAGSQPSGRSQPLRILELGKFYSPHCGGIETLLQSWCEGFARHGAEVDCVVANTEPRAMHERINGVNVHRLASFGSLWSTSLCPGYWGATSRYPADVWHAHFPNPLADAACVLGPKHTPLILSYHSDVIRQAGLMKLYGPLMRRVLSRATRIIIATPKHLEYSNWLAPYREKCLVIPFGINLDRFKPTVERERRVAELKQQAGRRPILLNIGRLVGYKGQRFLIEAAQNLDATVWLVGSGPLESDLKERAAALGMSDRVCFWGGVDEGQLSCLLAACDIFVLPSITPNEAFGLVQVEAMACGKPVISCDLRSGVPFVNQNGVTGRVVPPGNVQALAEAIRELLQNDELRARLGAAGQRRSRAGRRSPRCRRSSPPGSS